MLWGEGRREGERERMRVRIEIVDIVDLALHFFHTNISHDSGGQLEVF